MIGLRIGPAESLAASSAIGTDPLVPTSSGYAGVSRDATSGIYVPASSTEWTTFIAAAGLSISVPDSLWLCQEASGNLADSIGALSLTAGGTPGYQASVTGWTRKAVTSADGSTSAFLRAAASGPNPSTTSSLWVWLVEYASTPAANRVVFGLATTSTAECYASILSTNVPRIRVAGVNTNGAAAASGAGVKPWAIILDRAGSRANLYTPNEAVTGTYSGALTDSAKGYGDLVTTTAGASVVYGFMMSGAKAEAATNGVIKACLQAMGFTIPWS